MTTERNCPRCDGPGHLGACRGEGGGFQFVEEPYVVELPDGTSEHRTARRAIHEPMPRPQWAQGAGLNWNVLEEDGRFTYHEAAYLPRTWQYPVGG